MSGPGQQRQRWSVYVITFDGDGSTYVGMTQNDVRTRIQQHRAKSSNDDLWRRLRRGDDHSVRVVYRTDDEFDCREKERLVALAQERPLNGTDTLPQPGGRNYRPTFQLLTCNVCQRQLPGSKFHADRHRHTGRDGRCKSCRRYLSKAKSRHPPGPLRRRYYAQLLADLRQAAEHQQQWELEQLEQEYAI